MIIFDLTPRGYFWHHNNAERRWELIAKVNLPWLAPAKAWITITDECLMNVHPFIILSRLIDIERKVDGRHISRLPVTIDTC